jgi:hypothetical protein
MYHIVLIALVLTITLGFWNLVHVAPRMLARVFPRSLLFLIGSGLFVVAIFSAYIGSAGLREPEIVLGSFVQGFVGLWFMLAATADNRGTYEDEVFLRRLFAMVLVLMAVVLAPLYITSYQAVASLNLLLVGAGFILVSRFSRTHV